MNYTIHLYKERADLVIKAMGSAIVSTEEYHDEESNEKWVRISLEISDSIDVLNLIHSGINIGINL